MAAAVGRLRPLPRQRVTDEMVRAVLTWARNYGEIEGFELRSPGRRWLVTVKSAPVGSGLWMTDRPQDVMPGELLLSSREALAFGYGCVAGGEHEARAVKREEWGW